jgi:hypothetical protein
MTKFNKLTAKKGLAKDANTNDPDIIECVSIRGHLVDLRNVSPGLRAQYRAASRRVGKHEAARAQLNAIGEEILKEQMPNLATKAFAAAHKQSRVRGDHAVMAKLMGLKR